MDNNKLNKKLSKNFKLHTFGKTKELGRTLGMEGTLEILNLLDERPRQYTELETGLFLGYFTWSIPVRAFTLGADFWYFFTSCYPFMLASFAFAFLYRYFFNPHKTRIIVSIFKITYSILSKVKFIYPKIYTYSIILWV